MLAFLLAYLHRNHFLFCSSGGDEQTCVIFIRIDKSKVFFSLATKVFVKHAHIPNIGISYVL